MLWSLGAGAAARCAWHCAAAGCRSKVLLRDVCGRRHFGAWVPVRCRVQLPDVNGSVCFGACTARKFFCCVESCWRAKPLLPQIV